MYLVSNGTANTDPAWFSQRLQTGSYIHAVTKDVALLDNDISQVNADAKYDAPIRRDRCIVLGHCALYRDRAAHRIDDAEKFDKQSIASGLDDAAAMLGDLRIANFAPDHPQGGERAFL